MKIIRTVDTYAWHCRTHHGMRVLAPSAPDAKPKKPCKFDPTNWKNNDLYAMLGLEEKRHEATFEEIRAAYRNAVLVHHPDKQAQRANVEDDSHFKVLQKAFAVLSDPERRQQYDSIDFDESIPKAKEYSEAEFWDVFPLVFNRNARFSIKQPVPVLSPQMTKDKVDLFYTFWFNFESRRRFEFLDEEEVESGDRAEKRYIEKKNKATRQKRKTEDNARISKLVELAYKNDPRIRQWKEEEKRQKEAKKQLRAKPASPIQTDSSPQKSQDADKKRKEEQVKQAMAAANEAKAQKKAFRAIFNDNNFFSENVREMEQVSLLMEQAVLKLSIPELKELGGTIKGDLINAVRILESHVRPQHQPQARTDKIDENISESVKEEKDSPDTDKYVWTADQIDLLIKAVKLIPPGVAGRWSKITAHLNRTFPVSHSAVLRKAEDIKCGRLDFDELAAVAVPLPRKRDPRVDQAEPTILVRESVPNAAIDAEMPWSSEEQAALETAMKAVGPEVPDRWAQIAERLPGRTKQQVVKRVKEIAAKLKSKAKQ